MKRLAIGFFVATMISACATPKIDTRSFAKPRSVVIDDFPDISSAAMIGPVVVNWPAPYFSSRFDGYFVLKDPQQKVGVSDYTETANQVIQNQVATSPRPVSASTAGAMGAAGGFVGGLIQASAEATQKKAVEFPSLVRKSLAAADLRIDLLSALRSSLEENGIAVRISSESRALPPRMHWPAKSADGEPLPVGSLSASPPVEEDLLIQVSPVAIYSAPGPLNAYGRKVGIGLAMFDGRTRQFIGWQAVYFKSMDGKYQYSTYNSLVADLDKAAPALHDALISLVPEVVKVISGETANR